MTDKGFTTEEFSLKPSVYMRRVGMHWLGRNWWWLFALPAALAIGSAWQPVLIFVAMMLFFLLYPGVTMLVYFRYSLSPFARATLYSQKVTLGADGIRQEFYTDERYERVPADNFFATDAVEYGDINDKLLIFKLRSGAGDLIMVPLSAIAEELRPHIESIVADCGITFAKG